MSDLRPEPVTTIVTGESSIDEATEEAVKQWRRMAEEQGLDVSHVNPKDWAAAVTVGPKLLMLIGTERLEAASKAFYRELDKAYHDAVAEAKRRYASNGGGRVQ